MSFLFDVTPLNKTVDENYRNMDQSAHIASNELEDISFFNLQHNATANQNVLFDGGLAELSEALAAAQNTTPADIDYAWLHDNASQNLSNNSTAVSSPLTPGTPISRPKLGSRFSREVIKTLKHWLASHQQHPYPTEDEMGQLQQRTGLNKAQLTNWFANARRRGKIQGARSASPQVHNASSSSPVDIIQRPATPAFRRESPYKNPMQRWVDSPPEHEPANVSDIARAMASSSRRSSGDHGQKFGQLTYNDPWRSPYARSITSSAGTSLSSEASNRHSSDSQSSIQNRRVPRRKRASRRQRLGKLPAADPSMPYQCTFCTEVFRTKYDWQRHEKSLHLPLEQWICAIHGPRAHRKDEPDLCCVFCGEKAPDDAHIESHHYTACQERDLEERTFHRKDHLVQHLRLVHQAKFEQWSMANWMIPMPNIESRCGFCSATMSTWGDRADHLADHFKAGMTMANWKGDWGFTEEIVKLVECAVPPYFIDYERSTLIPMKGSDPPWGSPPNAYELLKIEVEFFVQNYFDRTGSLPSNDKMQLEACRIIFAADATANVPMFSTETVHQSWLRELIMSSPDLTQQARFGPIRTSRESRHSTLNINGKDHLFEQCTLEAQLQAFVLKQQLSGCTVETGQIQHEACEIIRRLEAESSMPSDTIANWLVKGIYSSVEWLMPFKRRVGIPETHDTTVTAETRSFPDIAPGVTQFSLDQIFPNTMQSMNDVGRQNSAMPTTASVMSSTNIPVSSFDVQNLWSRPFLPDDTNFFRIFETDMRRWVAATMSPKNPNCHVPSDEEIQHQARWLMYGGDDSWNQTPADYAEWLWRFKRGVGITKPEDSIDPAQLARLT